MKLYSSFIFLIILFFTACSPRFAINKNYAFLYEKPDEKSKAIAGLCRKHAVEIKREHSDWLFVSHENSGLEGYVKERDVSKYHDTFGEKFYQGIAAKKTIDLPSFVSPLAWKMKRSEINKIFNMKTVGPSSSRAEGVFGKGLFKNNFGTFKTHISYPFESRGKELYILNNISFKYHNSENINFETLKRSYIALKEALAKYYKRPIREAANPKIYFSDSFYVKDARAREMTIKLENYRVVLNLTKWHNDASGGYMWELRFNFIRTDM